MLIEDEISGSYCLFHEKANCSCINPVADRETLINRLNQEIKTNEFLNDNNPTSEACERRNKEIYRLKQRLKDLILFCYYFISFFNFHIEELLI